MLSLPDRFISRIVQPRSQNVATTDNLQSLVTEPDTGWFLTSAQDHHVAPSVLPHIVFTRDQSEGAALTCTPRHAARGRVMAEPHHDLEGYPQEVAQPGWHQQAEKTESSPRERQATPRHMSYCCCPSVAELCLTLCHPTDRLPCPYHLPEFAQTHAH